MELGEAETLRVVDEHRVRVRHVDADLDHRRRHERVDRTLSERGHDPVLFLARHASVDQADAFPGEAVGPFRKGRGGRADGEFLRLVDERVDDVGLPSRRELVAHESGGGLGLRGEADPGDELAASGRQFVEDGDVEVAVAGEGEGPRDGRGRHHEDVDRFALADEGLALGHAELVLFVDHDEPEPVLEPGSAVEEGVRADGEGPGRTSIASRVREEGQVARFVAGSGEKADPDPERGEPVAEGGEMLFCQDLGGRHEGRIAARLHREQHRGRGHEGLAGTDIALEEPHHRSRGGEIVTHLGDGARLRGRRGKGQVGEEAVEEAPGTAVPGPAAGAEFGTPAQEFELEGGEFLEGEAPARGLEIGHRLRIMERPDRRDARQTSPRRKRQPFGDRLVGQGFEDPVDEGAQRLLSDAGGERIDRHDAAHVRGGSGILVIHDLEVGMIDDDPPFAFLRLPVDDEPLAGRENLREIGQVEPSQDETVAEEVAAGRFDDGLEGAAALAAAEEGAAVGDADMKADGLFHAAFGKRSKRVRSSWRRGKCRIASPTVASPSFASPSRSLRSGRTHPVASSGVSSVRAGSPDSMVAMTGIRWSAGYSVPVARTSPDGAFPPTRASASSKISVRHA